MSPGKSRRRVTRISWLCPNDVLQIEIIIFSNNTMNPKKVPILSAPLTHSDWLLKMDLPFERSNIRYMLDQCKAAGWTRVYWRLFDGGRANYFGDLVQSGGAWDEDNYYNPHNPADVAHTDWGQNPEIDREEMARQISRLQHLPFDTLAEATSYGRSIGLEIHAWITLNEDDHAWGQQSRFTRENEHSRWRRRDGSFYHSQQSFAFPEVREYKLAVIQEVLEKYEVDGVFLDWMRTGDVRDDPQNDADGVADFGYEEPLVASFKAEYGVDPHTIPNGDERWVAWRAQPQTEFMRSLRQWMKSFNPRLPLAVMGQHPLSYRSGHNLDGNLRGLLLDTKTWSEEGLIDSIVAAGYYRDGGNAKQTYEWLREDTHPQVETWLYAWMPGTPEELHETLELAQELDTPQILFWEADYIDSVVAPQNKAELLRQMSAAADATARL